MITINDRHLKAIARAQHFVRSGITKSMATKHIEQLENDVFLLDQIHCYLRQQINEPGLPISPEPIDVGEMSGEANANARRVGGALY